MARTFRPTPSTVFFVLALFGVAASLGLLASSAAALPSCEAGPRLNEAEESVEGTNCDDIMVVNAEEVETVEGGAGDDIIFVSGEVTEIIGGAGDDHLYGELPRPGTLQDVVTELADEDAAPIYRPDEPTLAELSSRKGLATTSKEKREGRAVGGDGNQEWFGGTGQDWFYGQRGDDEFWGEGGNDLLYGGPGDDKEWGGPGWDVLGGGFGKDLLDGGNDSDMIRGDATIDLLEDNGIGGADTLSFATATAPGFKGASPMTGFPPEGGERGAFIRLDGNSCEIEEGEAYEACNGESPTGGGNDNVNGWQFENVIGSAFADVIVGNANANRIDGGGGPDVIYGSEGNDTLVGGAAGDYLEGGGGTDSAFALGGTDNCITEAKTECEGEAAEVQNRDTSKISIGLEQNTMDANARTVQIYMVGSTKHDSIHLVKWFDSPTGKWYISFQGYVDNEAEFDTSWAAQTPGCIYWPNVVHCEIPGAGGNFVDSILVAGMGSPDQVNIYESEINEYTSPVLTGGTGSDSVWGSGTTEDVLVDNEENDWMFASNWDDVLTNNSGGDIVQGGYGNDLILSTDVCSGDYLNGSQEGVVDGAQNSTSWSKAPMGIKASINTNKAGNGWSGTEGSIKCTSGTLTTLAAFADMEGSSFEDALFGSNAKNGILGRKGNDVMYGLGADDTLFGKNNVTGEADGADYLSGDAGTDVCSGDGSDTIAASCKP